MIPSDTLPGFVAWPPALAQHYRAQGYWQGQPLSALLDDAARQHPKRTALVCGTRRWSYAELHQRAEQLAARLVHLGLAPRDRVVVQLPNVAEFFVLLFALFRIGALPVLALPAHRQTEIDGFCTHSEAVAYVTVAEDAGFDHRPLARHAQAHCPQLRHIIVLGEAQEFIAWDQLLAGASLPPRPAPLPAPPAASEVAFLQLSGGSTGLPKLIARTHDDYFYSVRESARICALNADTVYLCALPAAHNFPLSSPGTLGVFFAGGCVVLAPRPSPEEAFPLIEAERVTMSALVPPLALLWLQAAAHRTHDLRSLRLLQVGGAKFSEAAARRVRAELGCTLQQVFGMAEGLVNYTRLDDPEALVLGTQGRPISPADEVRVVDEHDRPVPPGHIGHLLTRGPYTLRGYYRAPAHNAHAFTADGFYRTGDLVQQLPSGHLIVQGRAKDQINRGGDKVAAEELEAHLTAHPAVLNAALVAMPDAYLGEKSCAFVVCHQAPPRKPELLRFLRERGLAAYKIPDRIEFVAHLPHTAVGKVDKRALREHLLRNATPTESATR